MTKLSRKLLLSVLTVAFALITLGATTFAWFTLSTKAEIQSFDVEVTSGAGIEISADGSNYSNYISAQQIYSAITRSKSSTILDHVTSKNGQTFTTIDYEGELSFDKTANSGWAEFDLWFRSPEASVEVYMLNNTKITSTGVTWTSDANFNLTATDSLVVGSQRTLYGANAVRISTTENELTANDTGFQYNDGDSANIFELGGDTGDQRLDKVIKTTYGSVAYYNAKNPNATIPSNIITSEQNALPNVLKINNLPSLNELNTEDINLGVYTPVATLEVDNDYTGVNYYYGQITVRIWLEGWDPDMFNAIMADVISIHMHFGGHSPSSLYKIAGVPDGPVNLDLEENATTYFDVTVEGFEGNVLVETSDATVATVEIDQETKRVTITALKAGTAVIKVYLDGHEHIYKSVDVVVPEEPTGEED